EAEPDRGDRDGREPPVRADRERQVGEPQKRPAEYRESRLSEPVDEQRHAGGIKEPADPERADDQPDRAECEPEAQMQIRADIGESAPGDARLDEHREDDEPRPRIREERAVTGPESRRGFGRVARCAGARVDEKLEDEPGGRGREKGGGREENMAPAEQAADT